MLELQAKLDANQTNPLLVSTTTRSKTQRATDRSSSFNRVLDNASNCLVQKNQVLSSTDKSTVRSEARISNRISSSRPVEQKLKNNECRTDYQALSLTKSTPETPEQEIVAATERQSSEDNIALEEQTNELVATERQSSEDNIALEEQTNELVVEKGEVSDQANNSMDQTNTDQRMDLLLSKLLAETGVIESDEKTLLPESIDMPMDADEKSQADSTDLNSLIASSPEAMLLQVPIQNVEETSADVETVLDLDSQKVMEQLGQQLAAMVQSGQTEAKMQLEPEKLGQIIITTAVSNGKLSAVLLTDNSQLKELLTVHLSDLQTILNTQQLVVDLAAKQQLSENQMKSAADQTLVVDQEGLMPLQSQAQPSAGNAAGTTNNEFDFNPQTVMEQLVKQLAELEQSEQTESTIQLKPEKLGQIVLATAVSDGKSSTTLFADNPQIKQFLTDNLPVLQNILTNQNMTVAQDFNQQTVELPKSLLLSQILNANAGLSLSQSTESTASNNPAANPVSVQLELLSNAVGLEKLRLTQTQEIDPQELIKQVVTQLEEQNNVSDTTLTVQLKPEVMDEIVVKTALVDGKISVQLLTDNPQVKKILTANLEELKKTLNCQQLTVELDSGKLTNATETGLAFKPSLELRQETDLASPDKVEPSDSSLTGTSQYDLLPAGNGLEKALLNQSSIKTDLQVPQSYPADSNLDSQDIMEQIVKKVELLNKIDNSEIKIQLKPEYLGKMMIRIVMDESGLTARFTTESQQVKNLLEANLNSLKQNLEANGIKVERTEVNVQLDNGGNPGNWGGSTEEKWQEYASRQQNQYNSRGQDGYAGYSEEGFPAPEEKNDNIMMGDGRVDFMI